MGSDSAIVGSAHAAGSDTIRLGLVGCGNRGSGACRDALSTPGPVRLVAMGDLFSNRLETSLKNLQKYDDLRPRIDVPPERRFVGFDAYQKVHRLGRRSGAVCHAAPFPADPLCGGGQGGKARLPGKALLRRCPRLSAAAGGQRGCQGETLVGRGRAATAASAAVPGEDPEDPRRRGRPGAARADLFQHVRHAGRASPSRRR